MRNTVTTNTAETLEKAQYYIKSLGRHFNLKANAVLDLGGLNVGNMITTFKLQEMATTIIITTLIIILSECSVIDSSRLSAANIHLLCD